jgi:catechol 2,3-dioxygenase-like lactoylglutathione lyase family enzyme
MLTGLAHTAVCVPDVDAAVEWYTTVLGLRVLSPPYRMTGAAIEQDMGEGVTFLTSGIADVAGVRTTWLCDPWGVAFILVEKRHADRPYWRQHAWP